jgi:hypothetical protein
MRPVRIEDVNNQTKDSSVSDTAFLRILVRGSRLNLYQLIDRKEHYYLQEGAGVMKELQYKVYPSEYIANLEEHFIFRDQLKIYLPEPDSSHILRRIQRALYTEQDLAAIVTRLNGSRPAASAERAKGDGWSLFVMAGAGITRLSFSGDPGANDASSLSYKNSVDPMISAGTELLSRRDLGPVALRFELGFGMHSFSGAGKLDKAPFGHDVYRTYDLKYWNLNPAISVLYNIRGINFTRYYAGVGFSYNFSWYTTNHSVRTDRTDSYYNDSSDHYLPLLSAWPSLFLRAGARINRRLGVDGTVDLIGSVLGTANYRVHLKTYALKLVYYIR